ncbi:MAG: hypothetical protein JWL80_644 [Parcubacteria group bacterium]|nr:hypothetical protein [Parcubacteria group bacterium]
MKILLYDEFSPEDTAMMQALYSRSSASAEEHAEKVKKSGSGKFMERFYVGYGHASIADCGSTTLFIEGVSMLAAKAIQDWPLYSGQETSSRYIDMSKQKIVDPLNTKASKKILERWMKFYTNSMPELEVFLEGKYPRKETEDEGVYRKAIKARAFDILRGFLPAGVTTQLSWHTNLRQAHDKTNLLKHYPLTEVQEAAKKIRSVLQEKYANSFGHKEFPEIEKYNKEMAEKHTFFSGKSDPFKASTTIKNKDLEAYKSVLKNRPQKTSLPLFIGELGTVTFEFLIDFGSFRDIQRHRNGVCRMPLLTTRHGFNEWYLSQLSPKLRKEATALIVLQKKEIKALKGTPLEKQYYVAMGFNVTARVTYALPAAVYTMELRSGRLVHPSLRKVAHQMHGALKKMFPSLVLHADLDLDDWDVRRGTQDIKEKI